MVDKKTSVIAVLCVTTVLFLGLWINTSQKAYRLGDIEDEYEKLARVRTNIEENYIELRTEKEVLEEDYSALKGDYSDYYGLWDPTPNTGWWKAGDMYLCTYYMDGWDSSERLCTISHEFGHVHSLAHEDDTSKRALMHSDHSVRWDQWGINTPQADDEEGAIAIYGTE